MEVHEREESQLRRSSIKRPWEEDTTLPEKGIAWHSALLPPIDAVPYRRGSIQRGGDEGPKWNSPDPRESVMKKAKFEGHDYNTFPRQNLALNGKTTPSRDPSKLGQNKIPHYRIYALTPCQYLDPMYTQNRVSLESPTYPPKPRAPNGPSNERANGSGPADSHDTSNLCRRCRRLTIQSRESTTIGEPDSCEDCKRNPELAWITQETALWLTHLADTLTSGISSEQRGIIRVSYSDFMQPPHIPLARPVDWGGIRIVQNI